jgi:subtilisin family serine protease
MKVRRLLTRIMVLAVVMAIAIPTHAEREEVVSPLEAWSISQASRSIPDCCWGKERMRVFSEFVDDGATKIITVIDTGVRLDPDIAPRILPDAWGENPYDDSCGEYYTGHGTNTVRTVLSIFPQATIRVAKVFKEYGDACLTWSSEVAAAIHWAVDQGTDIILVQVAFHSEHTDLYEAIIYAQEHGVLVIAPRGNKDNDQSPYPAYPASYPNVLAVIAVDRQDERMSGSSYGKEVDYLISAPGEALAITPGGEYACVSGTSTAAAHAAGLAGFVSTFYPEYSSEELCQLIEETARDINQLGWDEETGQGMPDGLEAIREKLFQYHFPVVIKGGELP